MRAVEEFQADVAQNETPHREMEYLVREEQRVAVPRPVDGLDRRDAVEAHEPLCADGVFLACRGAHEVVEDERDRERHHREIDVAEAAVEHEVAEQGGEGGGHDDRQEEGRRALADVSHRDGIGVGAEAVERRLPEAEDAAIAPDEAHGERQDRHGDKESHLEEHEEVENLRAGEQQHQQRQHDQDRAACLHASQVDAEDRHSERLKILPVMPWGRSRSITTATMSSPTPPRTGVNS